MERLYRLTPTHISMAGAAMDFLLNNPRLIADLDPAKLTQLKETRDLFETYNSENVFLSTEATTP